MSHTVKATWSRSEGYTMLHISVAFGHVRVKFDSTGNTFQTLKEFDSTEEAEAAAKWLMHYIKTGNHFPWNDEKGNSKWTKLDPRGIVTEDCPF